MSETILLGRDQQLVEVPRQLWEQHLDHVPEHSRSRLAFMTEAHHAVRYFVVRELVRIGKPLAPASIAEPLNLTVNQVVSILDDLEKNLFFLVRNEMGAVSWAFPVTIDRTPHRLMFSSGERLYGA